MKARISRTRYQSIGDEGNLWLFRLRSIFMGANVMLAAFATSGLAVGSVERDGIDGAIKEICPFCRAPYHMYMAAFSLLLFLSLLGFAAHYTLGRRLSLAYAAFLLFVLLNLIAVTLLYVLVGTQNISMQSVWNAAVAQRNNGTCALELLWGCSGWSELCTSPCQRRNAVDTAFGSVVSPSFGGCVMEQWEDGVITGMNATPCSGESDRVCACPQCSAGDQEQISQFNVTCETVIVRALRKHLETFLLLVLFAGVVTVVGIVLSVVLSRMSMGPADSRRRDALVACKLAGGRQQEVPA